MGRESYSRGAYEAEQAEREKADARLSEAREMTGMEQVGTGGYRFKHSGAVREAYERIGRDADKHVHEADQKLNDMMRAGHAEANELNREYDRLLSEAERAQRAVRGFELEKLGMSPE